MMTSNLDITTRLGMLSANLLTMGQIDELIVDAWNAHLMGLLPTEAQHRVRYLYDTGVLKDQES